eukprot:s6199_g1.t1
MPPERIPPTIGFNIGRIQIDKVIAVFWDLGGHSSFRSVWHNYYSEVQGVMFIVDSADPIRIEEAKATLVEVISHDKLKGVPLLCLANKQDKPEALSIQELSRLFEFERLFSERPFHVHPCCALQGQGLEAGVRWLLAEADKLQPAAGRHYVRFQRDTEKRRRPGVPVLLLDLADSIVTVQAVQVQGTSGQIRFTSNAIRPLHSLCRAAAESCLHSLRWNASALLLRNGQHVLRFFFRTVVWVSVAAARSFAASLLFHPISNTAILDGEPPLLSHVLADSLEVPPLASRLR